MAGDAMRGRDVRAEHPGPRRNDPADTDEESDASQGVSKPGGKKRTLARMKCSLNRDGQSIARPEGDTSTAGAAGVVMLVAHRRDDTRNKGSHRS